MTYTIDEALIQLATARQEYLAAQGRYNQACSRHAELEAMSAGRTPAMSLITLQELRQECWRELTLSQEAIKTLERRVWELRNACVDLVNQVTEPDAER